MFLSRLLHLCDTTVLKQMGWFTFSFKITRWEHTEQRYSIYTTNISPTLPPSYNHTKAPDKGRGKPINTRAPWVPGILYNSCVCVWVRLTHYLLHYSMTCCKTTKCMRCPGRLSSWFGAHTELVAQHVHIVLLLFPLAHGNSSFHQQV